MIKKKIIIPIVREKRIERASYIWNMLGSTLNAFQSVYFLMIITRVLGIDEAGIFTIAYANANLFLNFGKYGMRYFQVSDIKNQFSFRQYIKSRNLTVIIMCVISIMYVFLMSNVNSYSQYKSSIILWMCLWKAADAIEDVYHGDLQKNGRLDIAGKMLCLRVVTMTIVWTVLILFTKNQVVTTMGVTIYTFIYVFVSNYFVQDYFSEPIYFFKIIKLEIEERHEIMQLIRTVFPLFLSMFLSFYIGNAPKYAIDARLSDELQACYGFIAMPVFVIGLLNNFIFNPIVKQMSILWNEGKKKDFLKKTIRQLIIVFGITLICIIGGYFLGVPVLSWLYHTNLTAYKSNLIMMILGGGFLGLSGLLQTLITIQRTQKDLMYGYLVVAMLALLFSNKIVEIYGIIGAVYLYVGLMTILSLDFTFVFFRNIVKSKKTEET